MLFRGFFRGMGEALYAGIFIVSFESNTALALREEEAEGIGMASEPETAYSSSSESTRALFLVLLDVLGGIFRRCKYEGISSVAV